MKRIIPIILTLCIIISTTSTTTAATTTALRMAPLVDKLSTLTEADIAAGIQKYKDTRTHWGRTYIGKLTQLEIISGGSRDAFNPNGDMSAAAFLKTVTLSLGYKIPTVNGAKWYEPYVRQAKKDKLIADGEFKDYTKPITREQAAGIMYRAATQFLPSPNHQGEFNVMKCRIRDSAYISDKYLDSFVKAHMMGLFSLNEKTGKSDPKGKLTRAQACTVVYRLLDGRERPKFEVRVGEYYVQTDEAKSKGYPKQGNLDNVGAINLIRESVKVTKGYLFYGASDIASMSTYYESEDEYKTNTVYGRDMDIMIHNDALDPRNTNCVYEISVFNKNAVTELHYNVLTDLMKYLFEKDSNKAMKEIDNLIDSTKKEWLRYFKEVKLNNRWLILYKGENSAAFSISITCKGGLSSKEFIKKFGV